MDFLSNTLYVVAATSLVVLVLYVYNQQQHGKKQHPIAGTLFNQLLNFHRLHDYMTDLATKYKTYRLITPFRNEVYTSDPANVEYILKTNFENYIKGTYHHDILKDLMGDGIFTVDGDKWREQRKISSYEFSTKVLRDFSSVIFRKNAVKLAHILSESADNNQSRDINVRLFQSTTFDHTPSYIYIYIIFFSYIYIQDLFMKTTLDSILKIAFGTDLDSMCGSSEEVVRFSNAFDGASALTLRRYVDITWKIKRLFNIGSEAKLKQNVKVVDEFVYKLIQTKTQQMHNRQHYFLVSQFSLV
ncbi:putative abieta-7,13-dien-18-ol hydroxylase [Helianthus annuus]|uniref:Abieta-7,13-dien-18-ol hydroxylase n=1 Tax=Helianthus annuus TaxID=4232 RepID=A0A9K3JKJ5_HELAN|nr:putative abieta-7,13-dien-18-ol hydroxylase [Helianthus annuus]KAJ0610053.1 putative abieta-7,13-dien-18-ol hydroxylase [Helianthus annuus]KAJ0775834.1 putative abieta-7,13-dien-18-ol hydroxylase [Helianthus annuus]KAJ0938136.1 putative abieta-7,13-dien-18-ol hydroxylase [Helianthus annuus]KAJ0946034.1 putative abieta-7,13-dien-18-ol hydroxylase [Helianthus annuus]